MIQVWTDEKVVTIELETLEVHVDLIAETWSLVESQTGDELIVGDVEREAQCPIEI